MLPLIELTSPNNAEKLCRKITTNLPEYFGLPEANESYAQGVHNCTNLIAHVDGHEAGLLSLSFSYPSNANIYWLGVLKKYQGKGVGSLLLQNAIYYAKEQLAKTITVETLAPSESDENYLKTYNFYCKNQFHPLFNLKPENYQWTMVYMIRTIENSLQELIALEEDTRNFGFEWPNVEMIIDQALSECEEINEAIKHGESRERLQEEIGDLLHTAISLCIFAGFKPEETLTKITKKFGTRMAALKEISKQQGFSNLKNQPIELLMDFWQKAKKMSKSNLK